MTCCNVLVAAYAFISCAAAFKVAKVEPKVIIEEDFESQSLNCNIAQEVHVKLGEPFEFICTADNWYEVLAHHFYFAALIFYPIPISLQWCAFKHLEKRCEIEWKRRPYNVTMGHCDFEGRVNFKVESLIQLPQNHMKSVNLLSELRNVTDMANISV